MTNQLNHSSIRFTDADTFREMLTVGSTSIVKGIEHRGQTQSLISRIFDHTRTNIATTVNENVNAEGPQTQGVTTQMLRMRILRTANLLRTLFDLSSKEWKNAPGIWEMLSFDEAFVNGEESMLDEALRLVREELPEDEDFDPDELINDLDEVIHQVLARRKTLAAAVQSINDTDLGDTTMLAMDSIPRKLLRDAKQQVERALTDQSVASQRALAKALCDAHDAKCQFELEDDEVMRVTPDEIETCDNGEVYLVRSKNVSHLGDHYIVIIGGMVLKPHGWRRADIHFEVPTGAKTPLDDFDADEELVLLQLSPEARTRFYDAFGVDKAFRIVNS